MILKQMPDNSYIWNFKFREGVDLSGINFFTVLNLKIHIVAMTTMKSKYQYLLNEEIKFIKDS